jgi:hypothetical protein
VALDVERAQATRQEYLDKIQAYTDRGNEVLDLDKMLGERKEELDRMERDLEMCAVTLPKAQAQGLHPRDNHDGLMELIELHRLLLDAKVDCVIEAGWLVTLVRDVSKVLEDLSLSPISGIPWDPRMADDVLGWWMSSWSE